MNPPIHAQVRWGPEKIIRFGEEIMGELNPRQMPQEYPVGMVGPFGGVRWYRKCS